MKPIFQNQFNETGNCLQACIASILELPLESVPHFILKEHWFEEYVQFMLDHTSTYPVSIDYCPDIKLHGYHIIEGMSPREYMHSVVGYNGVMIHDPHPDGGGVDPVYYTMFVAVDVSLFLSLTREKHGT